MLEKMENYERMIILYNYWDYQYLLHDLAKNPNYFDNIPKEIIIDNIVQYTHPLEIRIFLDFTKENLLNYSSKVFKDRPFYDTFIKYIDSKNLNKKSKNYFMNLYI